MKFLVSLSLLAVALAAPRSMAVSNLAPASPLDVRIKMNGNSKVRAILSNNGDQPLRLLGVGTLLDKSPVEKATVHINKLVSRKPVKFNGMHLRIATSTLDDSSFRTLGAGQSISTDFDLAHSHDLSESGVYHIELSGAFPIASASSSSSSSVMARSPFSMITGSVPYHSNRLTVTIDGDVARRAAHAASLHRRAAIQDCTGDQLAVTQQALSDCARLAQAAAQAAVSGSADKMIEYFKAADDATRCTVSAVFQKAAGECGTNGSGTAYYCSDEGNDCGGGVLAYTVPSANFMAYCPLYFQTLPPLANRCHQQDQATTNLHEMTHLREVDGSKDYGGYGYDFIQSLSPDQNINHADTYAMFANAIALGC